MKYRKLRIAWSVVCGILSLLLIVLFGLSFRHVYALVAKTSTQVVSFSSAEGKLRIRNYATANADLTQLKGAITFLLRERDAERYAQEWQHANRAAGFGWSRDVLSRTIHIPYWFIFSVVAGLAVAPWFHWSNRFSLRTLLIAMTLVAIALGAIVFSLK
jgi:hypothetical protein